MDEGTVSPWAAREQLDRIGRSRHFAESGRLRRFLEYVVEEALAGNAAALKEATIGNSIYPREPTYDPRFDSTVRVEARRLRAKLRAYYAERAGADRVRIELPTGTYVPVISWIREEVAAREDEHRLFQAGAGTAIVVMPFAALSDAPALTRFAAAIADELIFALEKGDGLRVASRGLTFSGGTRTVTDVARELRADAVIQGTVRSHAAGVRVTVELSDPAGFVQWSDRFDGDFDDAATLQERIAATIHSRLRLDSSKMRSGRFSPTPAALQANGRIYRARQLLDLQTPQSLFQALEIFRDVAAQASDYARGYSGIADCHCDLYRLGVLSHAAALREAQAAVRRALEIDPRSVEAHTSMATVAAWLEWDRAVAETSFEMALRLGENARCVRLYGVFLTHAQRFPDAQRMFRRARQIEPISNQQDCAEAVSDWNQRRFDVLAGGAAAHGSPEVDYRRALALAATGRHAEAARLAATLSAGDHPMLATAEAEILAWAGDPAEARDLLAYREDSAPNLPHAMLALAIREDEMALGLLERAIAARELEATWLRTDPRLDRVRDAPAFSALVDRLAVRGAPTST